MAPMTKEIEETIGAYAELAHLIMVSISIFIAWAIRRATNYR
jgi:hypothetical protein